MGGKPNELFEVGEVDVKSRDGPELRVPPRHFTRGLEAAVMRTKGGGGGGAGGSGLNESTTRCNTSFDEKEMQVFFLRERGKDEQLRHF
jgi:hypothetical protein